MNEIDVIERARAFWEFAGQAMPTPSGFSAARAHIGELLELVARAHAEAARLRGELAGMESAWAAARAEIDRLTAPTIRVVRVSDGSDVHPDEFRRISDELVLPAGIEMKSDDPQQETDPMAEHSQSIDPENRFFVALASAPDGSQSRVQIQNPNALKPLTRDEARLLAAWLLAVADPESAKAIVTTLREGAPYPLQPVLAAVLSK